MDASPSERRRRAGHPLAWALGVASVVAAGGAVLFFFDPAWHGFYPFCMFHRMTGLNCPGCGGLRALHQLTHGHLGEAFHLNALVVLGVPLAAFIGARWLWGMASGRSRPLLRTRPLWLWLALAVLIAFGILRNLPLPALARLSP